MENVLEKHSKFGRVFSVKYKSFLKLKLLPFLMPLSLIILFMLIHWFKTSIWFFEDNPQHSLLHAPEMLMSNKSKPKYIA